MRRFHVTFGRALASGISWRWIFLINLPIGVAAFAVTLARVGETPRRPGVPPDWYGFVTLAVAMFAGIFGLIRGDQDGWTSPLILAAFGGCVVALAAFILVEHWLRDRQPMLELSLFRNPALTGAAVGALTISASIFSVLLYLTLYLQDVLGYSAFATGLRFLPLTIPVILAAPIAGRLSGRVSQRLLIGCGLALIAMGVGLMTVVSATSGWTALLAGMIVSGFGSRSARWASRSGARASARSSPARCARPSPATWPRGRRVSRSMRASWPARSHRAAG